VSVVPESQVVPVKLSKENTVALEKILQGGVFLVTVFNGTIVKIARVERPLVIGGGEAPSQGD
jgi:hypothetical protein